MQKLLLTSLFTFLIFISAYADGINFFQGSWEQALAESSKTGKLLFIDAYAEWCGPCKFMSKEVFPRQDVGEFYNANFINYKIDVDTEAGGGIFAQYGGEAMPTYLFIDSQKKLVYKQVGSVQADEFIKIGKKVLSIPELMSKYEKNELTEKEKLKLWAFGDTKFKNDALDYLAKQSDLSIEANFDLMSTFLDNADHPVYKVFINDIDNLKSVYGKSVLMVYGKVFDNEIQKAKSAKEYTQINILLNDLDKFKEYLEGMTPDEVRKAVKEDLGIK